MKNRCALCAVFAALLCCVPASLAGALEIDGSFQLGNLGFSADRASTDSTLPGAAYLWAGTLSVSANVANNIQILAELQRDLVAGNTVSALFQYTTDYFRVGMGPYLGLFNSPATVLKSGISTLVGLAVPGKAFVTLRTDSSLGGQAGVSAGGYYAESDDLRFGFYAADAAICTIGLVYKQLSLPQTVDSLTAYSFDVKVFQKNIPFRLDFNLAYETLARQYLDGASNPTHGLASFIVGAGIDLVLSDTFFLSLGFQSSVVTLGSGVLAGQSAFGFAPLLFQASAGFGITLPDSSGTAP